MLARVFKKLDYFIEETWKMLIYMYIYKLQNVQCVIVSLFITVMYIFSSLFLILITCATSIVKGKYVWLKTPRIICFAFKDFTFLSYTICRIIRRLYLSHEFRRSVSVVSSNATIDHPFRVRVEIPCPRASLKGRYAIRFSPFSSSWSRCTVESSASYVTSLVLETTISSTDFQSSGMEHRYS